MELKKSILSFLLLFAYTIGFAHDFIPHYHIEDNHFGNKIVHDHSSIDGIHNDEHIDSGVYDYLVCAFSESNHSNHDDKNDILQSSINVISNQGELSYDIFQFVTVTKPIELKKNTKVCSKPIHGNSSCHSSRSNRRGPPIFS